MKTSFFFLSSVIICFQFVIHALKFFNILLRDLIISWYCFLKLFKTLIVSLTDCCLQILILFSNCISRWAECLLIDLTDCLLKSVSQFVNEFNFIIIYLEIFLIHDVIKFEAFLLLHSKIKDVHIEWSERQDMRTFSFRRSSITCDNRFDRLLQKSFIIKHLINKIIEYNLCFELTLSVFSIVRTVENNHIHDLNHHKVNFVYNQIVRFRNQSDHRDQRFWVYKHEELSRDTVTLNC